jgi:putative ABC transport system substrate-binding protein
MTEHGLGRGMGDAGKPADLPGVRDASLSRRQILRAGVFLAGFSLLSGRQVQGQQSAKVPRIGFLAVGSREGRAFMIKGFLQGLREHGYVEGRNIVIEYRFSEDHNDRLPALAAELIALKVQLVVASGTPASFAAKQATSTIPIVMGGIAADPIETGLVASLARPGGNITGMSMMTAPLGGKRLELLKRIVPGLARVAVFWNPPNVAYGPILRELEAAAPALRLKLQRLEVRVPTDFEGAFEAAIRQRAGALIAPGDPLVSNRPRMVADLALKYRLPTLMDNKEFVEAGGLVSLGLDLVESYRRAATHVDKILKGAEPGDLPMEQPTKLDLAINLKTARAVGLTIPEAVLIQASHVIQ